MSGQKLNIVVIECDSMDGRVMGCMSHPAAHTPNLDRLAERGTLLRNTYCNSPLCVPSRASMWSGLYTHHCQGWNNYKGLSENAPTFRTRLEDNGYRTAAYGKTDYLSGRHSLRARVAAWTRSADIRRTIFCDPYLREVITDKCVASHSCCCFATSAWRSTIDPDNRTVFHFDTSNKHMLRKIIATMAVNCVIIR